MAKVVIFGTRDTAELAAFYLRHDSPHEVVAFTVNAAFQAGDTFDGLPVVAFERLEERFPPAEVSCFIPMTARRMNAARREILEQVRSRGYGCISYVSSKATVLNDRMGENCFILEHNVIQPRAVIGDNVMMWSGNHIGHHSVIGDHAFITSHVVISGHCHIGPHCFLGVNATVRDGIDMAEGTFLAMASALTRDSRPWSVYRGNPARRLRLDSRRFNP